MQILSAAVDAGTSYRFRLLANPTVKKTVESEGEPKKARLGLLNEEAQQAWLQRKLRAQEVPFWPAAACTRLSAQPQEPRQGREPSNALGGMFEGILRVNDVALLQAALETGIGSAKVWLRPLVTCSGTRVA